MSSRVLPLALSDRAKASALSCRRMSAFFSCCSSLIASKNRSSISPLLDVVLCKRHFRRLEFRVSFHHLGLHHHQQREQRQRAAVDLRGLSYLLDAQEE